MSGQFGTLLWALASWVGDVLLRIRRYATQSPLILSSAYLAGSIWFCAGTNRITAEHNAEHFVDFSS